MANMAAKPKSILKKSQPGTTVPSSLPTPKSDAEKRRLEIAVEHATLIQERKDTQKRNLDAIEELSDYPQADEPTPGEIERFTSLVSLFQPSDYDALIEERHANSRCGYVLCLNPPRHFEAKNSWLRPKGSQNWCSDDCARKALYVKAQLDETPAWERRGGDSAPVTLRPAAERGIDISLPIRSKQDTTDVSDLARERGEQTAHNKVDQVTTDIVEKATRPPKPSTGVRFDDFAHQEIEGYRVSSKKIKVPEKQAGAI